MIARDVTAHFMLDRSKMRVCCNSLVISQETQTSRVDTNKKGAVETETITRMKRSIILEVHG